MKKYSVLEKTFKSLKDVDPRNAAEYAYALATLYLRDNNKKRAIHFGHESLSLFDKCSMKTAEDCAPRNVTIGGIAMPSTFIHQDVVRDRLKPLVL